MKITKKKLAAARIKLEAALQLINSIKLPDEPKKNEVIDALGILPGFEGITGARSMKKVLKTSGISKNKLSKYLKVAPSRVGFLSDPDNLCKIHFNDGVITKYTYTAGGKIKTKAVL